MPLEPHHPEVVVGRVAGQLLHGHDQRVLNHGYIFKMLKKLFDNHNQSMNFLSAFSKLSLSSKKIVEL